MARRRLYISICCCLAVILVSFVFAVDVYSDFCYKTRFVAPHLVYINIFVGVGMGVNCF